MAGLARPGLGIGEVSREFARGRSVKPSRKSLAPADVWLADCSYITPDCDKSHLADTVRRSFLVELGAAGVDDNRFACSLIEVSLEQARFSWEPGKERLV